MSTARLSAEHLSAVGEIEKLCFANPWSEESLCLLLRDGNVGFVTLEGGRAVAYVGMIVALDEGEITNVATHPDFRRAGHAEEVLSALIAFSREHGIARLTLEVRASNLPARTLYEKIGFTVCGCRRNFYRFPREDAILMEYAT